MTDQELKQSVAENNATIKEAERSVRDMKLKLAKYKGDKTEQTKHIQNLDNLINLSVKQNVEIQEQEQILGDTLMKLGEVVSRLRTMERRYYISEKVNEIGVDAAVEDYFNKIKEVI